MLTNVLFSLAALATLIPATLLGRRRDPARDGTFWFALVLGAAGPLVWVAAQQSGGWHTGFSATLWVTVAASMAIYAAIAAFSRHTWKLLPLMAPYMLIMGLMATVWQQAPEARPLGENAPLGWIEIHILVSVLTYALVTIAAVAALAAFLQERALKAKRPTDLTRALPSVADSERATLKLLGLGEMVLALGLLTGMATLYGEEGLFLKLDHKTILSLTTFAVIGGLLVAHYRSGIRGRRAARFVLLAYLLLTLGFPGVKFVTDVLIG